MIEPCLLRLRDKELFYYLIILCLRETASVLESGHFLEVGRHLIG